MPPSALTMLMSDIQLREALFQSVGKGVAGPPDRGVVIGRADPPAEIEGFGHAVTHGHEVGLRGQDIGHGLFLLRVSGAELADHAVHAKSLVPAFGRQVADMFRAGLDGNHSAMVHTAGQNVVVSAHGIGSCVHAGAGHDEHARFFSRAGDDGVGGKGGAQVDGAHGGGVAFLQDDAQRFGDGGEQIPVVRRDLGQGFHAAVAYADAVRVGSSDIDSNKHIRILGADG